MKHVGRDSPNHLVVDSSDDRPGFMDIKGLRGASSGSVLTSNVFWSDRWQPLPPINKHYYNKSDEDNEITTPLLQPTESTNKKKKKKKKKANKPANALSEQQANKEGSSGKIFGSEKTIHHDDEYTKSSKLRLQNGLGYEASNEMMDRDRFGSVDWMYKNRYDNTLSGSSAVLPWVGVVGIESRSQKQLGFRSRVDSKHPLHPT